MCLDFLQNEGRRSGRDLKLRFRPFGTDLVRFSPPHHLYADKESRFRKANSNKLALVMPRHIGKPTSEVIMVKKVEEVTLGFDVSKRHLEVFGSDLEDVRVIDNDQYAISRFLDSSSGPVTKSTSSSSTGRCNRNG
jgi:hypothetical protein